MIIEGHSRILKISSYDIRESTTQNTKTQPRPPVSEVTLFLAKVLNFLLSSGGECTGHCYFNMAAETSLWWEWSEYRYAYSILYLLRSTSNSPIYVLEKTRI